MSDSVPPAVSAMATSTQSLRDIAKWLVGGVVGTAAAVFAGSSLTSLGTLDPVADGHRMHLAIGGLFIGFGGLIVILVPAIRVLVVEMRTFREFVDSTEPEYVKVKDFLLSRYKKVFPAGVTTFEGYLTAVAAARTRVADGEASAADTMLVDDAKSDIAVFNADAGFNVVRNRTTTLFGGLAIGTLIAIVGFGVFAWAANPPPPKSAPPAFSLTIQGKQ